MGSEVKYPRGMHVAQLRFCSVRSEENVYLVV